MTQVSGPLSVVTESPAVVSAVWVQAPALRTHGAGAILPQRARATIDAGAVVTFPCAPGPAVLIWQVGGAEDQVPILVDDVESQTLAEVVLAAQLASGRTQDELAALVRQVTEGVAAVTAAASSASWSGDRLTVLGATSPPLTGDKGDPGPPGNTPTIGGNGNWWVGTVDTGVRAQGPAGDGTGDVLWSELDPVLDGKADVGHMHTPASIGAAPASHTHAEYAESSRVTALEDSQPIIVSSMDPNPLPGRIYFVTGA